MIIGDTINRIQKMLNSVDDIAKEAFKQETSLMSELNRGQLDEGVDALGNNMPNYASSNKKSGKINLFDKGDFHQGFKPLFDDEGVDMTSTDRKVSFLDPKYNTALGINEASQEVLIDKVIPVIQTELIKL